MSDWQKNQIKKLYRKVLKRYRGKLPETPYEVRELVQKIEYEVGGKLFIPKFTRNWTQCFVRARLANDRLDKERDDPLQFSYPPARYTDRGRANIPKFPVFYGGDDPKTVVRETKGKPGDRLYISSWKHSGPVTYAQFCFDVGTEQRIRRENENTLNNIERTVSQDSQAAARVAVKSISNIFLIPEHGISSALAHMMLYEQKIDAIEYACAFSRDTFNYALSPACADKLELWRIVHFIEGEGQIYYPMEVGRLSADQSRIEWSEVTDDSDPLEDEFFDRSEFGAKLRLL